MPASPTCSDSTPRIAPRSWPTIVAEALVPVLDPLLPWLRRGPEARPDQVLRALARSAVPPPATDPPPEWLRPEQRVAFGTLLTILRRRRGALLADPTGSGKTFIALAVSGALAPGRTVALVPATLRDQWRERAAALGIPLTLLSHEEVSRGRAPHPDTALVLVDEAHRFRNPVTRRYRTLAAWLEGRMTLFVTATPVVNSLADLTQLLRLALPDDALRPAGIPSLTALGRAPAGHSALGEVVVARAERRHHLPSASRTQVRWSDRGGRVARWRGMIEGLRLSTHRPTAELIRATFWSAAASSPAALHSVSLRYVELLDQAAAAREAGRHLSRTEIRRLVGPVAGQLVFWELVEGMGDGVDLWPGDRPAAAELAAECRRAAPEDDGKLTALKTILADRRRTLVFTTSVATVRYLRTHLPGCAWCTGEAAGIGAFRGDRATILGAFRPGAPDIGAQTLVATDIAAEGLDLQGAERVVQYDLPWTPMRVSQREGRVARLGSPHARVELVTLAGPAWLEREARRATRLASKATLATGAGLTDDGASLWRWRHDLAERYAAGDAVEGCAVVHGERDRLLIGFELTSDLGRIAAAIGVVDDDGGWSDDPDLIARAFDAAQRAAPVAVDSAAWTIWLERALPHARRILREGLAARWSAATLSPDARALLARLRVEGRVATKMRNVARLRLIERGIRFATRGHTAGEAILVSELSHAPAAALDRALRRLPADRNDTAPTLRLTGAILFRAGGTPI